MKLTKPQLDAIESRALEPMPVQLRLPISPEEWTQLYTEYNDMFGRVADLAADNIVLLTHIKEVGK